MPGQRIKLGAVSAAKGMHDALRASVCVRYRNALLLFVCLLWFLITGAAFVPLLGLQNDEALFGTGLFMPNVVEYAPSPFGHRISLMLMTYVGALKSWIYAVVFTFIQPSTYSIRVTAILIGALAIAIFWRCMYNVGGAAVAFAATVLLITDPTFLLTNVFDWGPVAVQHVSLIASILFGIRYATSRKLTDLFCCWLCIGVGLWDKALHLWTLAGLCVACAIAFPKVAVRIFRWKALAVSLGGAVIGGAPLISYNLLHHGKTIVANAALELRDLRPYAQLLYSTLDGSTLFPYLVANGAPRPAMASDFLKTVATVVHNATGGLERSLAPWGLLIAGVLALFGRSRSQVRQLAFLLTFMSVTWLLMVFAGGGASAHHVVLLWPAPQAFTAIALSACSATPRFRRLVPVVVCTLVLSNLLVLNEYYYRGFRFGGGNAWSSATSGLFERLQALRPRGIYIMDWGAFNVLCTLSRGRLPIYIGSDPFTKAEMEEVDRRAFEAMLVAPDAVFVTRTRDTAFFPDVARRFAEATAMRGCAINCLATVSDRHGRPTYEILRIACPREPVPVFPTDP